MDLRLVEESDTVLSRRRDLVLDDGRETALPRKAIPVGKQTENTTVDEETLGFHEHYLNVSRNELLTLRESGESPYLERLEKSTHKSDPKEDIDIVFLEFTDAQQITKPLANEMVDILDFGSDFFTVPVQPKLYNATYDEDDEQSGIRDWAFADLYDGTELFLRACRERNPHKPVLGSIPPLGVPRLEGLLELYETYDVQHFYFDFDYLTPTVDDHLARVGLVQRRVANQGIHRDVLTYGINMRIGTEKKHQPHIPAANFATVFMGIDIIGENHSSQPLPEEVVDEVVDDESEEDSRAPKFTFFDRNEYSYRELTVTKLGRSWPEPTALDIDTVVRGSLGSDAVRRRMQWLLSAEQMELELKEFRESLAEGTANDYLSENPVPSELIEAGKDVRASFQAGLEQRALGEFL